MILLILFILFCISKTAKTTARIIPDMPNSGAAKASSISELGVAIKLGLIPFDCRHAFDCSIIEYG